ncbi:hypothetical protein NL676_009791 [Syzygium grande]|nr:hypothetical protein NL676_009791 [Syzygium grande]
MCHFSGSLPSSLGNLSLLTELELHGNNLQGQIPVSFADLTQLSRLALSHNNLSGDTLEWVVNLTKLTYLDISGNSFFLFAGSVGSLSFLSLQLHGTTDLSLAARFLPTSKTPAATATKQNQRQGLPPPPQGLSRQARRHEDHPLLLPPARNPTPSINGRHSRVLSKISAWAEFVGYIGSVNLKIRDLRRLREDETCVE